jgi:hypothetical protein
MAHHAGGWLGTIVVIANLAPSVLAQGSAQTVQPSPQSPGALPSCPILTAKQLALMCPAELERLYDQAPPAPMLNGKVRGLALIRPGTKFAGPASGASRLFWQGKIFCAADGTAINRFFGVKIIRGQLYYGPSWRDGRPALILDYQDTSRIYAPYRDEIRQVAPGLFLGLMYERTCPQPTLKMYFALECPAHPGS